MEILYFIQVIQISLITLSLLINSNNDSKEMTGGRVGAVLKAKGKGLGSYLKSQGKKLAKAATNRGDRQMFQNKLAGLSGTQTSSERLTSASASVSMYRIIKFIVYFLSFILLPLMPFYAATKSLFTKGIPLFKEVVIPESVDYDKKILEAEFKKNKENQDKITK